MTQFNPLDGHDTATRRASQCGARRPSGRPSRNTHPSVMDGTVMGASNSPSHDKATCRSSRHGAGRICANRLRLRRLPIAVASLTAFGSHRAALARPGAHAGRPVRRDPFALLAGRVLAVAFQFTALVAAVPAQAQQAQSAVPAQQKHKGAEARKDRRDILVTGQRPGSTCDGRTSAQPIDYACLNGQLQTAAKGAPPARSAADAVTSQATTPSKAGTFSFSATSQRMGKNFGHSAQPYRPPPPVYTNPVRGAAPK